MGKKECSNCGSWLVNTEVGRCSVLNDDTDSNDVCDKHKEKERRELNEIFDIWDRGEYTFDGAMEGLRNLQGGQKVGDVMKECTICPVGNGTCHSFMEVELYGFNPDKPGKSVKLMVCSLGVDNIDNCPLSK